MEEKNTSRKINNNNNKRLNKKISNNTKIKSRLLCSILVFVVVWLNISTTTTSVTSYFTLTRLSIIAFRDQSNISKISKIKYLKK